MQPLYIGFRNGTVSIYALFRDLFTLCYPLPSFDRASASIFCTLYTWVVEIYLNKLAISFIWSPKGWRVIVRS